MRSTKWFLMAGVVICGALLANGMQTAHADNEFEAGHYAGTITLAIHLTAQASLGGASSYASVNWIGEGPVNLWITNDSVGEAGIGAIPVDIFDAAFIEFGNCGYSVGLTSGGAFQGGSASFIPTQKFAELTLAWHGPYLFKVDYETPYGCRLGKNQGEGQKIAIRMSSPLINNITLNITNIDRGQKKIIGDCDLPKWKGSAPIPNGSMVHKIDTCMWWAGKLNEYGEPAWRNK
jgi:hypothetical protein